MKKTNLVTGVLFLLAGLVFLGFALILAGPLDGLLFGLAGAGLGPGFVMICKYFYWNSPKNRKRYEEKLSVEMIEQHDELKEKLRNQSGRYTYVLGLMTVSISMVVFSVLDALHVIDDSRLIVLYLGGYLVFQIAAGIAIFNHLLKKY